ncbi:unnamed protein product [Didymodactylos carnosus]|uniref:Pentapeptide repeat-containing protein n=1 Tax=Didymodactylos carnosus TaxID=1234261 RepID=A0A814XBF6_9BILA|nr:unnamed protein product [Didymodactylos carnosus]CAF1209005.1 unnamed protein product [Didymodactylos carnosus]CAF3763441.1 unnamed protein product [Didymodactylos carnosus]CAF3973154.1 unnamed protein product [Didymodactylos carnosus]
MSTNHQRRPRVAPPPSTAIMDTTDPVSDTITTPPAQTDRREKRCLIWSKLAFAALVPLMIGIATVLIALQQQRSEDRRFQQTQENEDRRREQDQQQANDLHYQDVYKTYISDISNAIFKQQDQSNSFADLRTRLDYIRSQTLTALLDLDCRRKTWLFEFLHGNELLAGPPQSTSLDLSGAALSCIRITKSINSKNLRFNALALSSVDLTNASFIDRYFEYGADFSGSAMENINFTRSRFVRQGENPRFLFKDANLFGADFSGAALSDVSFGGADLSYAVFNAVEFGEQVDLTGTNLVFTTFKDVKLSPSFPMIITNANMTGALILEQEWFISAMNRGQIHMMDVILPNGTWLLNETKNFIRNGNAEENCISLTDITGIPNWSTFSSVPNSALPTLSGTRRNDSSISCLFNFTSTTADKPSSEAEYHLSFDVAGCQGGFMQIQFKIFSSVTTPVQSLFFVNGTDQLHWLRRTISEKTRANTHTIQVEIAGGDHTGFCYVDNVEFYIRRSGNRK